MWIGILYHITLSAMFGLVVYAAIQNVRNIPVPNVIFLAILVLYPVMLVTAPFAVNWPLSIAVCVIVLLLGYPLFSIGLFTSADVKLMALLCLWAGPNLLFELLLVTFAAGAILALLIFSREGVKQSLEGTGFARGLMFAMRSNTQVPFGFAIVLGACSILLSYEQIINLSL